MEKDDEETEEKWRRSKGGKRKMIQEREKNNLKRKYIQFYKMSIFEFGSPLLNYLTFNLLCTMLEPMK